MYRKATEICKEVGVLLLKGSLYNTNFSIEELVKAAHLQGSNS